MSRKHKERDEVYAVLRWDRFHGIDCTPETSITVKEIVRSRELAKSEVDRLNSINGTQDVVYWFQPTRLFPEGHSAGA